MAVNASQVLSGAPEQLTTGPILSAPRGVTLPTAVTSALDPQFDDSGYISEDGLTLTPERSTEAVRDWSGAVVKQILTEFAATLAWAHLETNEKSLANYVGDDNITVQAATSTEGKRITALLKGTEMPRKSWVFKVKDGSARVLIVVPDGQVSETGEVAFVKTGAITWPVTLATFPDASGVNVYIYLDDGQVLTAGVPVVEAVAGNPDPAGAGDLVTITGVRFTGTNAVEFGGVAADDFVVVNDSTLVATVPAGAAGAVDVTVSNAVGESTALTSTRAESRFELVGRAFAAGPGPLHLPPDSSGPRVHLKGSAMTFEVPASKASIKQNQFPFKVPGESRQRVLPKMQYMPVGFRTKMAEAAGPVVRAKEAGKDPARADLEKLGTLQMELLEKYAPGVTDALDSDQLSALLVAWQEASNISVGESPASAGS